MNKYKVTPTWGEKPSELFPSKIIHAKSLGEARSHGEKWFLKTHLNMQRRGKCMWGPHKYGMSVEEA